ncbi:MAG: HlyC/CorC family transporter [Anaerolineae bacterium]|nr:HlyC/CorC family transporter [Anaerolineae bacterium]
MDEYSIIALVGLLALHAALALAETAISRSRQSTLRDRADDGDIRAQRVLQLLNVPERLSITTDFLLTLIKIGIAAIVFSTLESPATEISNGLPLQQVLYFVVIAGIVYLLGSRIPITIGRTFADAIAPNVALPMQLIVTLITPLSLLVGKVESFILRQSHEATQTKTAIEAEIIDLVESSERESAIEKAEREMIRSVLEFDETIVREIMVPRPDITAVEMDDPIQQALGLIIESGHSRIPVYEDEIDQIKGILYAKDLLAVWYNGKQDKTTLRDVMRPAHFVPETKTAEDMFIEFKQSNVHLAVVVDEYGGTAGVITIEDIVEEIVGDIRDEFDATETIEFTQIGENEYRVDAAINLYDFNQWLDVELPDDEHDSLGGYLYTQFGRAPEIGERLETNGLLLRIVSVDGVRIRTVHVTRLATSPSESETGDANAAALSTNFQPRQNET